MIATRSRCHPALVAEIIDAVCDLMNADPSSVLGTSRSRRTVNARWMAMGLAREWTGRSFPELALDFCRRKTGHSTVVFGCARWRAMDDGAPLDTKFGPMPKAEAVRWVAAVVGLPQ